MANEAIFKFRRIDKNLLASLIRSEIWFSLPADLNDPFDCQVDILKVLERVARRRSVKEKRLQTVMLRDKELQSVQERILSLGVCSFSSSLLNPVLWTHYGDQHRGLVLTYCFPEEFAHQPGILGWSPVDYSKNPIAKTLLKMEARADEYNFVEPLIKKALTAKAKQWSYESEFRIIQDHAGPRTVDRSTLVQVCFGLRTDPKDRALVLELLAKNGYSAKIADMIWDERSDFGLSAIEAS